MPRAPRSQRASHSPRPGHPQRKPGRSSPQRTQVALGLEAGSSTAFKAYLDDVTATSFLSPEKEADLDARIAAGDDSAREELVLANLPLVYGIATLYTGLGVPLSDLVQEGNIGLMRAARKYRPKGKEKGKAKFATYAAWWVWQGIGRAVPSQGRTIEIPVHADTALKKIKRVRERVGMLGEDLPDLAALADEIGEPETRVQDALRAPTTTSIHTFIPDSPTTTSMSGLRHYSLAEVLPESRPGDSDPRTSSTEALALAHVEREEVARAWKDAGMTAREQATLTMRFDLDGGGVRSVGTVAAHLHVSVPQVYIYQRQGIRKLRLALGVDSPDEESQPPSKPALPA